MDPKSEIDNQKDMWDDSDLEVNQELSPAVIINKPK